MKDSVHSSLFLTTDNFILFFKKLFSDTTCQPLLSTYQIFPGILIFAILETYSPVNIGIKNNSTFLDIEYSN